MKYAKILTVLTCLYILGVAAAAAQDAPPMTNGPEPKWPYPDYMNCGRRVMLPIPILGPPLLMHTREYKCWATGRAPVPTRRQIQKVMERVKAKKVFVQWCGRSRPPYPRNAWAAYCVRNDRKGK